MDTINVLLVKPGQEHFKSLLVIGEDFVFQFTIDEECHIELLFCNIDTKYTFCHTFPPKGSYTRYTPCSNQPCTYKLFLARRRFPIPYEL